MRVLVSTTAGAGHVGPLVPVARACGDAGHEVRVAAPESFAATIESAGLTHAPFADVPAELMGPVFARLPTLAYEEANRTAIADIFGRLDAQAALPGLTAIVERWQPDVLVREPAELGSLAAAVAAGVPHATVAIGVGTMDDRMADHLAAPLEELDALVDRSPGTCASAAAGATRFSTVPERLDGASAAADRTLRYRDPPAPASGPLPSAWGDPQAPLVYVTFGSVAGTQGRFVALYRDVLDALADQPVRVLLTTGHGLDPADLGPPPTNARVERWWPQADVVPRAAAVVGHGGFGTTMAAVVAGVPQVVVPLFSLDQRLNAERVDAVGAGVALGGPHETDRLPAVLADLLTDAAYADAARDLADDVAALAPVTAVVSHLEALVSG